MNPTDDSLSLELQADTQAVVEHLTLGKQIPVEIARRIRAPAERITEEIYKKHGLLDIGVPAIRELRGELPE